MKQEIVLFDRDKEYLARFIVFFKAYMGDKLLIQGFSEEEVCCQYLQNHDVTLLLTYDHDYRLVFKEFPMSKTMLFSDVDSVCEINGIQAVYKYQKLEEVLRCILDYCAVRCNETAATSTVCEHSKLIGIYSPVKRCGKTAFAMEYAKYLAESEKVLFITLEEYAPTLQEKLWKYDLEDLIYFYLQNGNGFELKVRAISQSYQTFEWIPPVKLGDELRGITFEQWCGFFEKIQSCGLYDTVIVDISDVVKDILQLLSRFDFVIMPYVSDIISNQKRMMFEEVLKQKYGENGNGVCSVSLDEVIRTDYDEVALAEKVRVVIERRKNMYGEKLNKETKGF